MKKSKCQRRGWTIRTDINISFIRIDILRTMIDPPMIKNQFVALALDRN